MSLDWTQNPGVFASPGATVDTFLPGPHNLFDFRGLTLNDRTLLETFWVEELTGFDSPEIDATSTPNTNQDGSVPDIPYHRDRVMTLSGWIQAGTYPQLMRMSRQFLDAFTSKLTESKLEIYTQSFSVFTQPRVYIECGPSDKPQLSTKIEPGDMTGLLKRSFTIALKASRPRFLSDTIHETTLTPLNALRQGFALPLAMPMAFTIPMDVHNDPLLDLTSYEPTVAANIGNAEAFPTITLEGPFNNGSLVNLTTGQQMVFKSLSGGESIFVDVANTQVLDSSGNSRGSYVLPNSDWLWLEGDTNESTGQNQMVFYATDFVDGLTSITLAWQDSWK